MGEQEMEHDQILGENPQSDIEKVDKGLRSADDKQLEHYVTFIEVPEIGLEIEKVEVPEIGLEFERVDSVCSLEKVVGYDQTFGEEPKLGLELEKVGGLCSMEKVAGYDQTLGQEPKIGMEFESDDSAYEFYCNYAHKIGFRVRKQAVTRCKNSGIVKRRSFCCSRQGKQAEDKRGIATCARRAVVRIECMAAMSCLLSKNGKYRIVSFSKEHNHEFAKSPAKHMLRSRRKITLAHKALAEDAEKAGLSNKQTVDLLSMQAGGREHVGFMDIDYKNYLAAKRRVLMQKGDAGAMMQYFQNMKVKDPSFFSSIQLDENDLITNIFWADSRSMVDYGYFGDVLCFDTTYRTNEYGRPFVPILGVNHHKQTVIFGGALLYDETEKSFIWVFETFLTAMSNKHPKTIFTDQSQTMANAIRKVLPNTNHRLCVWHIYQNAAKHLSHVFHASKDFTKDFGSCVYDYEDEDEWLCAWSNMLEKYELRGNAWLESIFEVKEKWAMVYGRHMFTADMKSTQSSESMNRVLKLYLNSKNNLLIFFEHYTRLLVDRRYKELTAEFKMEQTMPTLLANVEMLRYAANIYTPEVYKIFEKEYTKAWDCTIQKISKIETRSEYIVSFKNYKHFVKFDSDSIAVECSCRKFTFVGVLCAHALKVLDKKNVKNIPAPYVLRRWTRQARDAIIKDYRGENIQGQPQESTGKRFAYLSLNFREVTTMAAEDESMSIYAHDCLQKLLLDLREMKKKCGSSSMDDTLVMSEQDTLNTTLSLSDQTGAKNDIRGIKTKPTVGRPRNKRYKDPMEQPKRRKLKSSTTQTFPLDNSDSQKQNREKTNENIAVEDDRGEEAALLFSVNNSVQPAYIGQKCMVENTTEVVDDEVAGLNKWSQRQLSFTELLQNSLSGSMLYDEQGRSKA